MLISDFDMSELASCDVNIRWKVLRGGGHYCRDLPVTTIGVLVLLLGTRCFWKFMVQYLLHVLNQFNNHLKQYVS